MGNSDSQFKRSRAQYGSSRSVAFSLPSKWDKRDYSYNDQPRASSVTSGSPRTLPKPILRNGSHSGSYAQPTTRADLTQSPQRSRSQSLHSLQTNSMDRPSRHSQYITSQQVSLTRSQYNDVYLKNDLRRQFRAQDRSHSVAILDEDDPGYDAYSSTASLDRKLFMLKKQRGGAPVPEATPEERHEGATEKRIKSRKHKKATAPPVPAGAPKKVGKFRKKSPAPQPPLVKQRSQSLTSLIDHRQSVNYHGSQSDVSLFDEIESELAKTNIQLSPTKNTFIDIPKPDYDSNSNHSISPAQKPSAIQAKIKKKAPSTPVKRCRVTDQPADSAALPRGGTGVIIAEVDVHHTVPTLLPEANVAKPKKEVREIAVQYDAPIEIAIQCSGHTLKQSSMPPANRSDTPSSTSLADILDLFNKVAKIGGNASLTSRALDGSESSYSDESSRVLNERNQKVVPLDEVMAGVPPPPPLPTESVRLIQRRTLTEDAPISMAPMSSPLGESSLDEDEEQSDSNPINNSFQRELRSVYEKLEKKRKSRGSSIETSALTITRQDSVSSEGSALLVYKHAQTIMGVCAPVETESDSGHDEPVEFTHSVSRNSHSSSIPDFVLEGIAQSIPSAPELPEPTKDKNDKTKFNSIRRIKKSVRHLMTSMSRGVSKSVSADEYQPMYSDENWTLSGRGKTPRPSLPKDNPSWEDAFLPPKPISPDAGIVSSTKSTNSKR